MKPTAPRRGSVARTWLASLGAMGQQIQSADWSTSAIGDIDQWPQSLCTALSLCLSSPTASAIVWGPARTHLYNDSYRPFCEASQVQALGTDFADGWRSLWPALRPAFERAADGESVGIETESQLHFSFVPIRDESGEVGGIFVSVVDAAPSIEIRRAQEEREALSYALSHDVRSPLRSMEQLARILLEDHPAHLPEDVRLFLGRVTQATATLGERADGILRFIRISHQPLNRQPFSVRALVDAVVAEQSARSQGLRGDVIVRELPDAIGDPELVRQAFVYILANAFKFTRNTEHPRIEISARRQDGRIEYSIADNGAGFDMKYAGRLFVLFHRLHSEAEFEGIGVGLALSRRIIERHGGSIQLEAIRGQGATVRFTLPALAEPLRAA